MHRLLLAQHDPQESALRHQQPGNGDLAKVRAHVEDHRSKLTDDEGEDGRYQQLVAPPPSAAKKRSAAEHTHQHGLDDHQEVSHRSYPSRRWAHMGPLDANGWRRRGIGALPRRGGTRTLTRGRVAGQRSLAALAPAGTGIA